MLRTPILRLAHLRSLLTSFVKQTTNKKTIFTMFGGKDQIPDTELSKKSKTKNRNKEKASDKYLFDISDFKLIKKINSGTYGTVYLVENKQTKELLAAKTSKMEYEEAYPLYIAREISILIRIQHPTIIKFRGYSNVDFNGNKQTTFLMDYLKRGSLSDLLKNESHSLCDADYDNTKRQIILIGVARGMMILHKYNVIHRDLKAENILLEEDYSPQISDFGLAKFFDPENSMKQSISCLGTIPYMAPEVSNSTEYDVKADVYSFGILMYEILTGTRAYSEEIKNEKLTELTLVLKINDGYRPKFKVPIKKGLRKMIELCWSENPKERPTFCEIFLKLSLLDEDDFVPFKLSYNESQLNKIDIDNDDDDDEPKNMKFCLPDVDTKEVFSYVEKISQETMLLSSKLGITKEISSDQNDVIMNLKKENEELKRQIIKLKKQCDADDKMKKMPETRPNTLINKEKSIENKSPVIKKSTSDMNPTILKPQSKKSIQSSIISKTPQVNKKVETRPSSDMNKIKSANQVHVRKIYYSIFIKEKISEQIKIVSEILSNSQSHPFYLKLQKFLNYIKCTYFKYYFKDFEYNEITSITEEPQIEISIESTKEILDQNWLNSTEFIQILKEFEKGIAFSIEFPSSWIESQLSAISSLKYIHQCEIEVIIYCNTYKNLQPILKQYPAINSVMLCDEISKIEPSAFEECRSIKYVEGRIVEYISDNAFKGRTSLQNFCFFFEFILYR